MFAGLKEFLFGSEKASKSVARSRLHFVLVQDRAGLSPDEMANFKKELVGVIERYFVIDEKGFDIDYKRESETTTLLINSPVIVRRQDNPGGEVGAKHGKKDKNNNKKAQKDEKADKPAEAQAANSVS